MDFYTLKIRNNLPTPVTVVDKSLDIGAEFTVSAAKYLKYADDDTIFTQITSGDISIGDANQYFTSNSEQINHLKRTDVAPKTDDKRPITAIMPVPPGYTVFPTGSGDDITNNTLQAGDDLILSEAQKTAKFQMLNHWYGLNATVMWEGADMNHYLDSWLTAPATVGSNVAGDYNKVFVGAGNIFVPAAPGTGAWSLDLNAKIGSSGVLQCTPVPSTGNQGFFDYDSDSNTLTVNPTQTGSHNLCDWDVRLFKFSNKIWGSKLDGQPMDLFTGTIVGKLLFNSWFVEFELKYTPGGAIPGKCCVLVTSAVKGNV